MPCPTMGKPHPPKEIELAVMQDILFLPDPPAIRVALHQLTHKSGKLDVAVAFIGADWWDLLGNFSGKTRVICWLSSVNTNPYAVAGMLRRANLRAKQHNSMQAKIYLAPKVGAIVGSANLSKAALNEFDTAGQCEAAVLVRDRTALSEINSWFEEMWTSASTREITSPQLAAAKSAWDEARANASHKGNGRGQPSRTLVYPPPPAVPARLKRIAREVQKLKLEETLKPYALLSSLDPAALTRGERKQVIEYLRSWAKRRWVYSALEKEPISRTRRGLTVLFDESKDIRDRLESLENLGLFPGLRIPSLSLLLYWRNPRRYLPFNHKTEVFLQDFKRQLRGASATSAACYANWLDYSNRLYEWLELPYPGHVDRVVSRYYDLVR